MRVTSACRLCSRWFQYSLRDASQTNPISGPCHQQIRGLKYHQERTVRAMYWRGRSFDKVNYDKRRNEFLEWSYRSEIFAFSRRLQENLDESTLRKIFSHPSYVSIFQENQAKYNLPEVELEPNTQFVQRGIELLEECIKPYLRYTFDKMPEDGIRDITNYLKCDGVLADVAKLIGCKDIVLSEEYPPGLETMANTTRALIAGIEKDLGYERARRFIVDMIISYLNDQDILDDIWVIPNPKETLNLILSNSKLPAYEPRLMFQTGVKTVESCHLVGLYTDKKFLGSSPGETLDIAEECAALDALQRMFDLKEYRRPYIYGDDSDKIDYDVYKSEHHSVQTYKIKL